MGVEEDEFAESQAPRLSSQDAGGRKRSWMPVWRSVSCLLNPAGRKCFWKLVQGHEATCGQGSSEDLLLRWLLHSLKNMYKMVFIGEA